MGHITRSLFASCLAVVLGATRVYAADAVKVELTPGVFLEITNLSRMPNNILKLSATIRNDSTSDFDLESINSRWNDAGSFSIIDNIGMKQYYPLRSDECICTRRFPRKLNPGAEFSIWAHYPSPPPSVDKVSVFVSSYPPIDDVPIQ